MRIAANRIEIELEDSGETDRPVVLLIMGMGMQLAASVILCGFAGWWLDGKYGTEPWFMVSGGFFGAVAGLTHFIRTALSMGKQKDVK